MHDDGSMACSETKEFDVHGDTLLLNWFKWRVFHWDTKWNAFDLNFIIDKQDVVVYLYSFLTAWGPPWQILDKLSIKFPDLQFTLEYFSEGGSYGKIIFSNASVISKEIFHPDDVDNEQPPLI